MCKYKKTSSRKIFIGQFNLSMDPDKETASIDNIRFGTASPQASKVVTPVVQFQCPIPVSLEVNIPTAPSPPLLLSPSPALSGRGSWSNLFSLSRTVSPLDPSLNNKNNNYHPHSSNIESEEEDDGMDFACLDLPEIIFSWQTLQKPRQLPPRGLANYGNMCFLNAILQTLLHCGPLINMFSRLRESLLILSSKRAPFLRALSDLYAQQEPKLDQIENTNVNGWQPPMVPESLYSCIRKKSMNRSFLGAQEDAQEFLTFLLDQIHEELVAIRSILRWSFSDAPVTSPVVVSDKGDSEEWTHVGRNQKKCVSRTMGNAQSPISFLFFGRYKSVVKRPKSKESITMEPFHCISLDIHHVNIVSLEDALRHQSIPELIEGGITKTLTIDFAPPIMLIQLNRIIFNPESGPEKVNKFISYPKKLCLLDKEGSSYRLHAVIYHHGRSADGGHYTCHVRHCIDNDSQWIFFDDTLYSMEPLEAVLKEKSSWQNAYLLCYMRE